VQVRRSVSVVPPAGFEPAAPALGGRPTGWAWLSPGRMRGDMWRMSGIDGMTGYHFVPTVVPSSRSVASERPSPRSLRTQPRLGRARLGGTAPTSGGRSRCLMYNDVPLCIDLAPSDVTGPLASFQGRRLTKDDMKRLVNDVSEASDKPMAKDRVETLFSAMWPGLESTITEAARRADRPASTETESKSHRSTEDMLAELVDRVRGLERNVGGSSRQDETIAAVRALIESGRMDPNQVDTATELLIDRLRLL
jgi:hypothetical protein